MKKLTFILIQIAFIANTYSQSFLKDGLTWNNTEGDFFFPYSNFTYEIHGDTIISNKNYKFVKVDYPDKDSNMWIPKYYFLIRDDSSKWYIRLNSMDILLYDFNVNIGDSVTVYNYYYRRYHTREVSSIDSVTLENGERRKRIRFTNERDIWVEGLGSVFYPLDEPFLNGEWYITPHANICVQQNDTLLYTLYPDLNCYDTGGIFMNLADVSLENDITVYPNPAKEEVNILSTSSINDIEIYDIMGRRIFQTEVRDYSKTINLSLFRKGVYIAKINTEQGIIKKKFIVQ